MSAEAVNSRTTTFAKQSKATVLIVLLITCLAFFGLRFIPISFDLTSSGRFSFAPEIKRTLRELPRQVTIRLYLSESDNSLPVSIRNYGFRIKQTLRSIARISRGMVVVDIRDPEKDSESDAAAALDEIGRYPFSPSQSGYFGLVVECLNQRETISFIDPAREDLLRYDLLNAILKVARDKKNSIGVWSALPVLGNETQNPWIAFNQLTDRFDVIELDQASDQDLWERCDLLLVVFPQDLPEHVDIAIEHHLEQGKDLVVLADPYCLTAENLPGSKSLPANSQWPNALTSRGLSWDPDKILIDMRFRTSLDRGEGPEVLPIVLTLTEEGVNQHHPVSVGLDQCVQLVTCPIAIDEAASRTTTVLLQSSVESALVPYPEIDGFTRRQFDDVSSSFKSAELQFPTVVIQEPQSAGEGRLVVFTDVDWIYDAFCVEMIDDTTAVPSNGNVSLLLNTIDYLTGEKALSSARVNAVVRRPLTRLIELERAAERQFQAPILQCAQKIDELETQLLDDEVSHEDLKNGLIQSVETKKRMEQVRIDLHLLRLELNHLEHERNSKYKVATSLIKWSNVAGMPLLLLCAATCLATFRRRRGGPQ